MRKCTHTMMFVMLIFVFGCEEKKGPVYKPEDMSEIDLNPAIAEILTNHGVQLEIKGDEIHASMSELLIISAVIRTQKLQEGMWKSRMDMWIKTESGEEIREAFSDFGPDLNGCIDKNIQNFCGSTLYPLLRAFGSQDEDVLASTEVREIVSGRTRYEIFEGNIGTKVIPEVSGGLEISKAMEDVITRFNEKIEKGIQSGYLGKHMHWFRAYCCQMKDEIVISEFLMDNEPLTGYESLFKDLPLLANVTMASYRRFYVVREKVDKVESSQKEEEQKQAGFFSRLFGKRKEPQAMGNESFEFRVAQAIEIIGSKGYEKSDDEVFNILLKAGNNKEDAIDLVQFLPVACTTALHPDFLWPDRYALVLDDDEPVFYEYAANEKYQIMLKVAGDYYQNVNRNLPLIVASRAAQFATLQRLVRDGIDHQNLANMVSFIMRPKYL